MKTAFRSRKQLYIRLLASVTALAIGFVLPSVHGQIFVSNTYGGSVGEYTISGDTLNASLISGLSVSPGVTGIAVSGQNLFVASVSWATGGIIGEYTTSGATVNASLISGLNFPSGIAVSGSSLFVVDTWNSTIGEYTTSGATVNASLIPVGYEDALNITVSGSNLFVTNYQSGTVGKYTTSGATVNASFITGLSGPHGIAVSGSRLFVANDLSNGTIGEYDAITGAMINASLISGLNWPSSIAVSGSHLFVAQQGGNNTISEYNLDGTVVNASLIIGLNSPWGIAVVPEPHTYAAIFGLTALGFAAYRRRKTQFNWCRPNL